MAQIPLNTKPKAQLVKIRDIAKNLLFCFDPETGNIEVKRGNIISVINIKALPELAERVRKSEEKTITTDYQVVE